MKILEDLVLDENQRLIKIQDEASGKIIYICTYPSCSVTVTDDIKPIKDKEHTEYSMTDIINSVHEFIYSKDILSHFTGIDIQKYITNIYPNISESFMNKCICQAIEYHISFTGILGVYYSNGLLFPEQIYEKRKEIKEMYK